VALMVLLVLWILSVKLMIDWLTVPRKLWCHYVTYAGTQPQLTAITIGA